MIHVVAALLISKKKFLIAQRAKGELKGYWEFPGGKVEKKESSFVAIQREIREEIGLLINPIKCIGVFSHEYDFAKILLELIECKLNSDDAILNDGSHTEIQWIDFNMIVNFAPLDKKIFDYINKNIFL